MPARARTPQDAAAAAPATQPTTQPSTPPTRQPAKRGGTRPPAVNTPTGRPPAGGGGSNDPAALAGRVRTLEQTVNALIKTAAANQQIVGSLLRHINEISRERLAPPPPPPPPIKTGSVRPQRGG